MRQARRATEQLICTIADWIELGRTAVQIGGTACVFLDSRVAQRDAGMVAWMF